MDLDKVAIEIRPRRPWEAVDLGLLMARRWYWPLLRVWLCVSLPVFIVLAALPLDYLWWQFIVIWWLKPIFERPLLDILSQTVFGQFPSTRETLVKMPKLALRQIFASLLWRRLSPSRSLDAPVAMLEGLNGARRSARLSVLHREGTSPALGLTIFGFCMEFAVAMSMVSLVFAFIPQEMNVGWDTIYAERESRWVMWLVNALAFSGVALVAPLYVASGFALYLNRRIRLEAWDIEIAFKRIVSKRQSGSQGRNLDGKASGKIVLTIALAILLPLATPPNVNASSESLDPVAARERIIEIKQGEHFNQREIRTEYSWPWEDEEEEEDAELDFSWDLEGLARFLSSLASLSELVLWLLVFALIGLVVYRYRHWLLEFAGQPVVLSTQRKPSVLFGLEVTADSLPENIGQAALGHWQGGEHRLALSLLYRASLVQLMHLGVDLRDGDTEGVCLRKAQALGRLQRLSEDRFRYFHGLTVAWQQFAYGHLAPTEKTATDLCQQWNTLWEEGDSDHE